MADFLKDLEQIEKLGVDIDQRLFWLWQRIFETEDPLDYVTVAFYIRAAYGQGYLDGQKEPYGKLQADNGYSVPQKIDE